MRRLLLVGLVAGCGFKASNAGQNLEVDAPPAIDASGGGGDDAGGDDAMADAMLDAPSGPQCPAGYLPIVGLSTAAPSKYRFVSVPATWLAAEMDCEDDGDQTSLASHLVVLDSGAERSAMIAGPLGISSLADQWIGATDLSEEGDLRYVTSQQSTLSLNPGMNADNKDCVRIHNANSDEYRNGTETNNYVCECDAVSAASSRYPSFPNGNTESGGGGGGG